MKRYLLFTGYYHVDEGWDKTFRGDFDTIEEARNAIDEPLPQRHDWFDIVDTDTRKVIERGSIFQRQETERARE